MLFVEIDIIRTSMADIIEIVVSFLIKTKCLVGELRYVCFIYPGAYFLYIGLHAEAAAIWAAYVGGNSFVVSML